jgi:hypothetical protein
MLLVNNFLRDKYNIMGNSNTHPENNLMDLSEFVSGRKTPDNDDLRRVYHDAIILHSALRQIPDENLYNFGDLRSPEINIDSDSDSLPTNIEIVVCDKQKCVSRKIKTSDYHAGAEYDSATSDFRPSHFAMMGGHDFSSSSSSSSSGSFDFSSDIGSASSASSAGFVLDTDTVTSSELYRMHRRIYSDYPDTDSESEIERAMNAVDRRKQMFDSEQAEILGMRSVDSASYRKNSKRNSKYR